SDPNLNNRLISAANSFPYMQDNTPATAEFQAAVHRFAGNAAIGGLTSAAWVSGKILEKAGSQLPEPPSTEALLAGLWRIKNDDFGGLTYPLTFVEGKPSVAMTCWFTLAIRDSAWRTTDGYQRHCL